MKRTRAKTLLLAGWLGLVLGALVPQASAADGTPVWTNRYNWLVYSNDQFVFVNDPKAVNMVVDGSGNVFVAGYSSSGTTSDYATIKYSSTGVPLWTNFYNGPGNGEDEALAIAVDASGNVFVTGESYAGGGDDWDYATIKYSGAGVPLWTNRYSGPFTSYDYARAN